MKTALLLLLLPALAGCYSTAGPFVTSITSDGHGNITVEKNMLRMATFGGALSVGENPTVQTLRVVPNR
jgi:hypothetical protein